MIDITYVQVSTQLREDIFFLNYGRGFPKLRKYFLVFSSGTCKPFDLSENSA